MDGWVLAASASLIAAHGGGENVARGDEREGTTAAGVDVADRGAGDGGDDVAARGGEAVGASSGRPASAGGPDGSSVSTEDVGGSPVPAGGPMDDTG